MEAGIALAPGLTIDEKEQLENQVDNYLDVSSLVVGLGGVGLYPTMIMETTDVNWMAEVVSHEWVHNYLTLRPLGLNYETNAELRTMNETTASLAGKEIGSALIQQFYPEKIPPPPVPVNEDGSTVPAEPAAFDFRKEMHITRLEVDRLLALGKVDEAESYMESRRAVFLENGYLVRKLNQAYFAFHGAYADSPVSAAGKDPVGEAVRQLRAQTRSLADFLWKMSWLWSFDELQNLVNSN
jgi:hypothetical protein